MQYLGCPSLTHVMHIIVAEEAPAAMTPELANSGHSLNSWASHIGIPNVLSACMPWINWCYPWSWITTHSLSIKNSLHIKHRRSKTIQKGNINIINRIQSYSICKTNLHFKYQLPNLWEFISICHIIYIIKVADISALRINLDTSNRIAGIGIHLFENILTR